MQAARRIHAKLSWRGYWQELIESIAASLTIASRLFRWCSYRDEWHYCRAGNPSSPILAPGRSVHPQGHCIPGPALGIGDLGNHAHCTSSVHLPFSLDSPTLCMDLELLGDVISITDGGTLNVSACGRWFTWWFIPWVLGFEHNRQDTDREHV